MAKAKESEFEWWLKCILVIVLLMAATLAAANYERLHVYQRYFLETSPSVTMRYEQLSGSMDEAAVRRHFEGTSLNCAPEGGGLGDRVCYAHVDEVDGMPALSMALFFNKGRLGHALIQTPWWHHLRQKQRLLAKWGQPHAHQQSEDVPLLAWNLPNGQVVYNSERVSNLNPMAWGILMWTAREHVCGEPRPSTAACSHASDRQSVRSNRLPEML